LVAVSPSVEKLEESRLDGNLFPQNAYPVSMLFCRSRTMAAAWKKRRRKRFSIRFLRRSLWAVAWGRPRCSASFVGIKASSRSILRPGRSTTFKVLFPIRSQRQKSGTHGSLATAVASERGAILVVDDEDVVLQVAQAALERAGYRILTASKRAPGTGSLSRTQARD